MLTLATSQLLAVRGVPAAGPTVRLALAQAELRILQSEAQVNAVECLGRWWYLAS